MDENILKYRQKHKRCKFCKYLTYDSRAERICGTGFFKCKIKDKIIRNIDIKRFCKYYIVKEEE